MNRPEDRPDRGLLSQFLDWIGLMGFIYGPLDRRLSVRAALLQALHRPVPDVSFWGCFGGIALFLFMVQVVTGIVLMFHYVPSEPYAYQSIRMIMGEVPFGWLVRTAHHWSGSAMILVLFVHTLRVFFTGAYARPRDLNWIIGVLLYLLVAAFLLTGNLLPWSSSAYWSTVYWTDLVGRIPVGGRLCMLLVRGGDQVTGATLTRLYALHVAVLPILSSLLMAMHFAIVRKLGISEPL